MPRPTRLRFLPFRYYYVVLRSVANRKVVTNEGDLATILKVLRVTLHRKGVELHGGYIAENELHLALRAGQKPLSAVIGSFQHEYARVFNRAHHQLGSLFRPHHYVLLVQHEHWLVRLVHFIHWIHRLQARNDYPGGSWWSSDAAYRGSKKQEGVTTRMVLQMLAPKANDRQSQAEAYRKLFERAPEPDDIQSFKHGSADDRRFLGDSEFADEVLGRTGRRSTDRNRRSYSLEEHISSVVKRAIEQFNALCEERLQGRRAGNWKRLATFENVRSKLRKRPLPMVRALSVGHLVEHRIATVVQAASFFRCGPRSVSAHRRRVYEAQFQQWFGITPEMLFSRRHDSDQGWKKEWHA